MQKRLPTIFIFTLAAIAVPSAVFAHCPLCTAGAGALAVFAASIGVPTSVVGVFVGAFALALGLWISRTVKKKYVKYQDILLTAAIFLTTVIPIMPFADEYRSFSLFIFGDYGSLLNRTYLVNNFLLGAVAGGILLLVAPPASRILTKLREGRTFPYQGLAITLIFLITGALLFYFIRPAA